MYNDQTSKIVSCFICQCVFIYLSSVGIPLISDSSTLLQLKRNNAHWFYEQFNFNIQSCCLHVRLVCIYM